MVGVLVPGVAGSSGLLGPAPGRFRFLEVFRGAGGLSIAVCDYGRGVVDVLSAEGQAGVNVRDDDDFAAVLAAEADWMHGALPRRTF